MTIEKYFGAAVRSRRNKLSWSQKELADRSGLHRTYLSDIERGARNVSLRNVARLAKALRVPAASLVPKKV
jgi:transcriptional regulator with XRE-family HTH domain